jgi:hypothetical protein
MEAVRNHVLERTERSILSSRSSAHARRVPVYTSLVYNP